MALDRLVSQAPLPGDHALLHAWAGTDPRRHAVLRAFVPGLDDGMPGGALELLAEREETLQETLQQIRSKGRQSARPRTRTPTQKPRHDILGVRRGIWSLGAVLGAVLVLVVSAIFGVARLHSPHAAARVQQYATKHGQYITVVLADGSRATLGPATTLRVRSAETFASAVPMEVTVTGEALFSVTHRAGAPFVVRAGPVTARVLGTTFTVRRYADERATRVVVADGRIALRAGARSRTSAAETVVSAQTLAVVDSGAIHVVPDISVDELTAWTSGRLVFRNTPLRDVLAELARVYGVPIRLADSVLSKTPVTWTVPTAERSLPDVLDGLTTVLDAHATRANGVITITSRRAPARRDRDDTLLHPTVVPESQYGR